MHRSPPHQLLVPRGLGRPSAQPLLPMPLQEPPTFQQPPVPARQACSCFTTGPSRKFAGLKKYQHV